MRISILTQRRAALTMALCVISFVALSVSNLAVARTRGNIKFQSERFAQLLDASIAQSSGVTPSDQTLRSDSLATALVLFETKSADSPALTSPLPKEMSQRRKAVLSRLQNYRSVSEEQALDLARAIPGVTVIRRFFIMRAALINAPISSLVKVSTLPGVSQVIENVKLVAEEPVSYAPSAPQLASGARLELTRMSIPNLWSQGITGAGRVVASFDTGVDGLHPALAPQYLGATLTTGAGFYAPNSTEVTPFDKVGHGTHTMGTMVGHNAADTFGVAPGASWISAAVVDQGNSLNGTLADILSAFEWALNPDNDPTTSNDVPDVILNSWGIPVGLFGPCDDTFWGVIDNVEAAGIVTIFAAGNEGPNPFTIRSPANRITSPLNAFSVGAIDNATLAVADFSSRGPSTCDSVTIKPEVVAPGISIYSTDKGGGYAFRSGTSMAAPYMAGLVALLRQYNPNATVSQIKQAIIGSASDIGAPGEDNASGHGLPDAVRALSLLPAPSMAQLSVTSVATRSGLPPTPGSLAEITINVQAPVGAYDSLNAVLRGFDNINARILQDTSVIFFSPSTGAGQNIRPFSIEIADTAIHGQTQRFTLEYTRVSGGSGSVEVDVTIGSPPPGALYTHTTNNLAFTVSDFGQFGFGAYSAYSAGGAGLRVNGGANVLYESGLVVGRNALQLSTSIRDSLGVAYFSDFRPYQTLLVRTPAADETVTTASYRDTQSAVNIPITVKQRVTTRDLPGEDSYAVIEFTLVNHDLAPLTDLRFSWFNDFDLAANAQDEILYEPGLQMTAQYTSGLAVGVSSLTELGGVVVAENTSGKSTLTSGEAYNALLVDSLQSNTNGAGDYYFQVNFGPFNLQPFDSQVVAVALVTGSSLAELSDNAARARARYLTPTGVDDDLTDGSILPGDFTLEQNYPNPFNPSTTIEFALPHSAAVRLRVFNVLGQIVATLVDSRLEAGQHGVSWDGTTDYGSPVASGVYFYRLETGESAITRKMTLLK